VFTCKYLLLIYSLLWHVSHKMVVYVRKISKGKVFHEVQVQLKEELKAYPFFFSLADLLKVTTSSLHALLCCAT